MKVALCYQGYERRALFESVLMKRAHDFKESSGSQLRIFASLGMHIKHYAGKSDWSGWNDAGYIRYKSRYTSLLRNKSMLEAIEWEPDVIISMDDDMILNHDTISLLVGAHEDGHAWCSTLAHRLGYLHNPEKHDVESSNINIPLDDPEQGFRMGLDFGRYINHEVPAATEIYSLTLDMAQRMSDHTNGCLFSPRPYPAQSRNMKQTPADINGFCAAMDELGQKCFIVDDNLIRYNPHIAAIDPETYEHLVEIDHLSCR